MKPALKLVNCRPSNDEIARYYFDFFEALELLKCSESVLRELLNTQDFGQVKLKGIWYLHPDLEAIRTALWGKE